MPPALWGWKPVAAGTAPDKWIKVKDERADIALPCVLSEIAAYVRENVRYSRELVDQWSPPAETLERGTGDCEDMALLKRSLFIEAGGKEEETCLLVVWDQIARLQHAVLLVDHGGWKLLDAYNSLVLPVEQVRDYTPQFAYIGDAAWVYGR